MKTQWEGRVRTRIYRQLFTGVVMQKKLEKGLKTKRNHGKKINFKVREMLLTFYIDGERSNIERKFIIKE